MPRLCLEMRWPQMPLASRDRGGAQPLGILQDPRPHPNTSRPAMGVRGALWAPTSGHTPLPWASPRPSPERTCLGSWVCLDPWDLRLPSRLGPPVLGTGCRDDRLLCAYCDSAEAKGHCPCLAGSLSLT